MHEFDNERFRFGSAQIATEEQIAASGAFDFHPGTRFGGFAYGKPFGYSGLAGEVIVGGARSGKLATLLAYQLCPGGSDHHRIILDVKAEAFFISNLVAVEGRYKYAWNPNKIEGMPNHRINPVEHITIDSPAIIDHVISFCEMVIPLSGSTNSVYFEKRGRWFLQNLCLVLVELDGVLRLDRLYWAVMLFVAGTDEWHALLAFPMTESRFSDVRRNEEEIHTLRERVGGGFDGICGEMSKAIMPLSSPLLRESVSPPYDMSMRDFCLSDNPLDLHLCPKGEHLQQWAMVIKSFFLCAKTYRAEAPRARRQHWIIDEAAQLGAAKFLLDAYSIGAGSWGVTPLTIWQSTYQMRSLGENAENILLGSAGYQAFFGIRDYPSAEALSKRIGNETREYDDTAQQARAHQGHNEALLELLGGGDLLKAGLKANHNKYASQIRSKQKREVRTPDEILNMPPDRMFVFMDGVGAPIYGHRYPYYEMEFMCGRFLGSPYYSMDSVQIMTKRGPQSRRIITEPVPTQLSQFPQYQQSGQWSYVEGFRPCL